MSDTTLAVNAVNWNVEQAGTLGLKFFLNVLNACMSDEVQPLAVAVCEGLGTRIWLCTETKLIVQEHARRKHRYTPWGRIGLSIGFSPDDIADALSQSAAGEQFLGLATALLSLKSHFEAAKVLDYLLRDYIKKGFMPEKAMLTLKALQNLMAALEDRMCASGFADSLVGWDSLLRSPDSGLRSIFVQSEASADHAAGSNGKTYRIPSSGSPTPEVLCKLIDALANIYRIGDANFCRMRVPGVLAAWVITYVRWTTGVTPAVRRYGDAREDSILMRPNSQAVVEVCEFDAPSFDIETFKNVSDLGSILEQSSVSVHEAVPWFGVVKVQTYFGKRLKDLQDGYTAYEVRNTLLMLAIVFAERFRFGGPDYGGSTAKPFGSKEHVISVMQRAFDLEGISESLETLCEYRLQQFRPLRDEWHIRDSYLATETSKLFLEVLLLSTIDGVLEEKGLEFHVKNTSRTFTSVGYLISMMADFLRGSIEADNLQPSPFTNMRIYPHLPPQLLNTCVLELVTGLSESGVHGLNYRLNVLIRSNNGHVIYPKVLETLALDSDLPIRYRVLPGKLQYAGSYYSLLICANLNQLLNESPNKNIVECSSRSDDPHRVPKHSASHPQWGISEHSGYLSMYWTPYADEDAALSPIYMLKASARILSSTGCKDGCISYSQSASSEDSIDTALSIHCKTLGEAMSDFSTIAQPIRILSTCKRPQDYMYIRAAISHLFETKGHGLNLPTHALKFIAISRGRSCLHCAIRTATEHLEAMMSYKAKTKYAEQKLFAIVID